MNATRKRSFFVTVVTVLAFTFTHSTFAQENKMKPTGASRMNLDEYLEQVAQKNDAFRSSSLNEDAAKLRAQEWTLLTAPTLLATGSYINDQRESASALQPTKTETQSYSLGLQKQTTIGLQTRLLYNLNSNDLTYPPVSGLPAGFLPEPRYTQSGPVLELTQSLWRNGFGSEIRATQEVQAAQTAATKYAESFRQTTIRAEAESAFWRLALGREAVELARENLDRARRIRQLNASRAQTNLGDRADLLQSDAALLARELELEGALDEERAAARAFNSLRGVNEDVVPEFLPLLDQKVMSALHVPERKESRDDVKAAAERRRLAVATARLGAERNKPTVEAFGTLGLNGRDASASKSVDESLGGDHPNYTVGVRATIPLDFGTMSDDRKGYRMEEASAEAAYRRAEFENERLWNDLTKRFSETQKRLALARKFEAAQNEKLEYERLRHRRGRSTTFQILQFEQDNATAQLSRIRLQAELLNIFAQLKTFGGKK